MSTLSLFILWDDNPRSVPRHYPFSLPDHRTQFLLGVESVTRAEGHQGRFVPHAGYVIENGQQKEVDPKAKSATPWIERHILWGDDLQPGIVPEAFHFDTVDEAACFETGVRAGMGHAVFFIVPDSTFRVFDPHDVSHVGPEMGQRFEALIDRHTELFDNMAASPDGRWVQLDWQPEEPVGQLEEGPLSQNTSHTPPTAP